MKWLYLIFLFCVFSIKTNSQVKLYLKTHQFNDKEQGSYVEIDFYFVGSSLKTYDEYEPAHIKVDHLFLNENQDTVYFNNYLIHSPIPKDGVIEDFHDIERVFLLPGKYTYIVEIEDLNDNNNKIVKTKKEINIESYFNNDLKISSILLANQIINTKKDNIYKRGNLQVIPNKNNIYEKHIDKLPFYFEVYCNVSYLYGKYNLKSSIHSLDYEDEQTTKFLSELTKKKSIDISNHQAFHDKIDISNLPSGKYQLKLELFNSNGELVSTQHTAFNRVSLVSPNIPILSNDEYRKEMQLSLPSDSLYFYLSSIIPIAGQSKNREIIRLLKENDTLKMRNYMNEFWVLYDRSNSLGEWLAYKERVLEVDEFFSTSFQMGHETDRGRVFLQYGRPSQVTSAPISPSEYPYEIWQYDKIKNFSNRRFVFYNPTNLTKQYELIHSDMIGELQNPRWTYKLNKRNTPDNDLYDPNGSGHQEHWGGNSNRYYNSY